MIRLHFNRWYFVLAVLLFVTEVLIAIYVHDAFVRPYVGDFLVVILIYCFTRSFFDFTVFHTAWGVLIFSYLVELLQLFNFVAITGLHKFQLARIVFGTSFAWEDILAYTLGIMFVLAIEYLIRGHQVFFKYH